jgi:glycosyltransferase involved in cell wall biosynthesis
MFVKNSFEYDARVTKEAKSLIGAGHDVTVVALYVPRVTPFEETTTDGIHVIRVPRSGLGVPELNMWARRYASWVERRRTRLTGRPYNAETVRELGQIADPSTAAPGADTPDITVVPEMVPRSRNRIQRIYGRTTTKALRSVSRLIKKMVPVAKRLLGNQSQKYKHKAIDKRMVAAGLASHAQVFHCHDLNTLKIGLTCKNQTGAILVYDSHELQTERSRMDAAARSKAMSQEGSMLPYVDAMITASPSWVTWNRDLYGTLPDPTIVVLNVPEPTEIDRSKDLRTELTIPDGHAVVIYQGSIQEHRGIEPAIDAVESIEGVTLVVIGYGHHRPALEADVKRRDLTDRVQFFGPVPNDELISYSASADIGLANIVGASVSYHTSLPNKLFEYAMAGIPVIGSDSPQIGRIVKEERIGEVCDPEDGEAIADAITAILADPSKYSDGLANATRKYNWRVEERLLVDLYASLTGDGISVE